MKPNRAREYFWLAFGTGLFAWAICVTISSELHSGIVHYIFPGLAFLIYAQRVRRRKKAERRLNLPNID